MDKTSVTWDEVHKKEARGQNDLDLGEVQEVGPTYVHTRKGHGTHTDFYIPKYLVQGFDGHKLWFNINEPQLNQFVRDKAPEDTEYRNRYATMATTPSIEQSIPVIPEPRTGVGFGTTTPSTAPTTSEQGFGSSTRPRYETTVTPGTGTTERGLYKEETKKPKKDEEEY